VNRVVSELITHGKVVRPRMGITLDDRVSGLVTRRLGVEGVLLMDIERGSPAEAAGLVGTKQGRLSGFVPGDIVQEVDGKKVGSSDELLGRLGTTLCVR
jgi:S1-C subfamily serine protease